MARQSGDVERMLGAHAAQTVEAAMRARGSQAVKLARARSALYRRFGTDNPQAVTAVINQTVRAQAAAARLSRRTGTSVLAREQHAVDRSLIGHTPYLYDVVVTGFSRVDGSRRQALVRVESDRVLGQDEIRRRALSAVGPTHDGGDSPPTLDTSTTHATTPPVIVGAWRASD